MAQPTPGRLSDPMAFVFTDVVGSTRLWAADPEATARSFVIHDAIVRDTLTEHRGAVFGWAGDSFRAAFAERHDAVRASSAVHARLAQADWSGDPELRVRVGVTFGQALHRDGEYFGPTLNTAARLEELANPGQTVVTSQVAAGLDGIAIVALGRHRVRDVTEALELFQIGERDFASLRSVDTALSTIPPSTGSLVGRDQAVAAVRAALEEQVAVTVVGTGGAGKTRLAIEVAHLELRNYPDGCYFVDLAPLTSAEAVGPAIARASRMTLAGGDPVTEIVDHFADRRALLIIDNCEHLVSCAQDIVRQLGRRAPTLSVLATSREALGVASERVIELGPLETVEGGGPAVDLFVERIRDRAPDFEPTPAELAQIAQVCLHLDGIPLALELAAARAGVLGLSHLLDGMHDRFRLLSSTQGDGTRTLREAIDWSFGLLSDAEQEFFVRCGVFNGPFDLRAASAVVPDVDPLDVADLLHSLSRKSLMAADGPLGGRFRLLETIRAYALLRLEDAGLTEPVRRLHFEHYVELVAVAELAAGNDLDRAVRLSDEWSNIAGALEWGTDNGEWDDSARMASGCLGLWEDVVPAIEGKRWVERILPNIDPTGIHANLLCTGLAGFEAQLDDFATVKKLLDSLSLSPLPEVRANALALLGYLIARTAPHDSLPLFAQAEALVAEHDLSIDAQVTTLWTRGAHALYEPQLDEAYGCFRRGFDLATQTSRRTINTLYVGLSLATTQLLLDRPSDALATLDSYNWADTRWDSSAVIRTVALLDLDRANEAAEVAFSYAYESVRGRLLRMSNDAMVGLAALALHRGEHDHAWTLMRQAVTPRTPFTIALVEGLADRVGHGDELRTIHRQRTVSLAELDAIEHLQAELDRLNTAVADRS